LIHESIAWLSRLDVYKWILNELLIEAKIQGCEWASDDCRFYVTWGGTEVRMHLPDSIKDCFYFKAPGKWAPYATLLMQLNYELKGPKQMPLELTSKNSQD
jgi:hypothetical protein